MQSGKLIYVVDDDVEYLRGIELLLSAHGLGTRTFTSAEALQADADVAEAECLILDIHLGGISGIELLYWLSGAGIGVPVVLVTANDTEATRKAAAAAGCGAFLVKPFSAKTLLDAMNRATRPDDIRSS